MYDVKGGRSIVCYFCFEEAKGVICNSFRFEEHVGVVCVLGVGKCKTRVYHFGVLLKEFHKIPAILLGILE